MHIQCFILFLSFIKKHSEVCQIFFFLLTETIKNTQRDIMIRLPLGNNKKLITGRARTLHDPIFSEKLSKLCTLVTPTSLIRMRRKNFIKMLSFSCTKLLLVCLTTRFYSIVLTGSPWYHCGLNFSSVFKLKKAFRVTSYILLSTIP